jgi:ubiquinone/menaquinone biosynthesis C-methylase UbiE
MTTNTKPDYKEFTDPEMASTYDLYNQHYTLEKKFFFDFANRIKAKKIIDLGCGTGLLTIPLSEAGYKTIGVEPAKAMLDIAKQKPDSDKVKWIYGDALDLSEENADLTIMAAHVSQFLLEDKYFLDCLKSINKALVKGGYLIFDSRKPVKSFADLSWPTKDKPKVNKSSIGEKMLWWANILQVSGKRIMYEIHTQISKSEKSTISVNELIFRTEKEITKFLIQANFNVEKIFGDWDMSEVRSNSPEMIFVAKKVF